jgi:hypothetical protein
VKYAVEMRSVAMMHILSFIKIDLNIQKLMAGDSQMHMEIP